jgi:hypothetical protein
MDNAKRPGTLAGFQIMFNKIYPASTRTLEHAGVHLAEESGEFTEALTAFRGEKKSEDFQRVLFEAADYFSCLVGVFSSMNLDFAKELSAWFSENCNECHNAPCTCSYSTIKNYKI